jgi:hypothetical protein
VVWVEKSEKESPEGLHHEYCICVYDLTQKSKIYSEKLVSIKETLRAEDI